MKFKLKMQHILVFLMIISIFYQKMNSYDKIYDLPLESNIK